MHLSILVPARSAEHCLRESCRELLETAASYLPPASFEIVIIVNGEPEDAERTVDLANELAREYEEVVSLVAPGRPGKGAALKWGARVARGRVVALIDADLPYEPTFLEQAARAVEGGASFVVANRRIVGSELNLPASWWSLARRRHLLGMLFNRLVRALLPIESTDTQAGAKAMSREFAVDALERVRCPGFLFDLELFLCAAASGVRVVDLPVSMRDRGERSTVKIARQVVSVLYWLTRITWRHHRRAYRPGRRVVATPLDTEVAT